MKFVVKILLGVMFCGSVMASSDFPQEWIETYTRPKAGEIPVPANNPMTPEKIALGKTLFFDQRLSHQKNQSCMSCHNPGIGWEMGIPLALGAQVMGRKSPTLLNLAYSETYLWDGRADSLEKVVNIAVDSPKAMGGSTDEMFQRVSSLEEYQESFKKAFPKEGLTKETIAQAIGTYERTILSSVTPFERWVGGDKDAVTVSVKRGFKVFQEKANCVACHSGWNFSDQGFHDIGLMDADLGRGKQLPTAETMQHAFKTPTLFQIAQRSPYMHNGSIPTLEEVVKHYEKISQEKEKRKSLSPQLAKPFSLSSDERNDLIAFLESLSGKEAEVTIPRSPYHVKK